MRKSRLTEHQFIAILKSIKAGSTVKDVCRKTAISESRYPGSACHPVVHRLVANRGYPLKCTDTVPELVSLTQWAGNPPIFWSTQK